MQGHMAFESGIDPQQLWTPNLLGAETPTFQLHVYLYIISYTVCIHLLYENNICQKMIPKLGRWHGSHEKGLQPRGLYLEALLGEDFGSLHGSPAHGRRTHLDSLDGGKEGIIMQILLEYIV